MPLPSAHTTPSRRAGLRACGRGLTMIELVVFMAVVSTALAGVLRVFVQATAASADPALARQALAVAESLLEEVQLMPFTFCDGDDANVATATSAVGCALVADAVGAEAGEGRYATPQFDHVNDYNGFSMAGITDITSTAVTGLAGYSASVTVAPATLGSITAGSGDALRITVTVTGPSNTRITLDGYRARYAPNASL
jgi:MSHA pilin protein MshD